MPVSRTRIWLRDFLARDLVSRITQLLRLAFLVIELLIALRILLRVVGANPTAAFMRFVVGVSDPFVAPFKDVFKPLPQVNGHEFETTSLLAMVVYAVLVYLVVRVVRVISSGNS